jgi:hypothetical protein
MDSVIPILLILAFFGVSFFTGRLLNRRLRVIVSLAFMGYFLVMFLLDGALKYPYLLFALLSFAFALRIIRSPERLSKPNEGL